MLSEEKFGKIFSSHMKENKNIVILGGGFGGVRAALDLGRCEDLNITLIDKNKYHSYTPDYYETATAILKEPAEKSEAARLKFSVAIPFSEIFRNERNVNIIQDEATGVDFEKNIVSAKSGKNFPYDYLVIALGAVSNFFEIPNLKERAIELKTVNDALNIRNTIDELFASRPKREKIRIVVAGGGFSGSEFAAEVVGYAEKLAERHGRPKENVECLIVESGDCLLKGAGPWVQKRAEKRLLKLGVKVVKNYRIANVLETEIKDENKEGIPYDILIWTAGVKANEFVKSLGLELQKADTLLVDEFFRVKGVKNVFAIGDIAYNFSKKNARPAPMTAQAAIKQGQKLVKIIKSVINKKKPAPYVFKSNPFIIPLGGKYGLADLGFLKVEGFLGWTMRSAVTLRYFFSILSFWGALKLWFKGRVIYLRNDL